MNMNIKSRSLLFALFISIRWKSSESTRMLTVHWFIISNLIFLNNNSHLWDVLFWYSIQHWILFHFLFRISLSFDKFFNSSIQYLLQNIPRPKCRLVVPIAMWGSSFHLLNGDASADKWNLEEIRRYNFHILSMQKIERKRLFFV